MQASMAALNPWNSSRSDGFRPVFEFDEDVDEDTTNRIDCNEVILDDGQKIVVSHPRRKNHNRLKKSPPTTPAKSGNETSACLERKM